MIRILPANYTESMNDYSKLQDLILNAYGTCDFLAGLTNENMRRKLEDELVRFAGLCTDDRQEVYRFASSCLLTKNLPVDEILNSYSPAVFKASGSSLLEDFRFADEYFQSVDPAFPPTNQNLLSQIFQTLADTYGLQADWLKHWIRPIVKPDIEKPVLGTQPEKLKESLAKLDSLIGLDQVKAEIRDLSAMLEISRLRQSRGLKSIPTARHLVFIGNPGTGKTTTARILAQIYKDLGFLSKGQLIECDRSDLVGEYIGSSAQKTKALVKRAKGGILFIDEAYSLARASEKDFGHEAIEILLKEMEDNRDDLVVIAAGYPDLMEKFLNSNPGLRSRFTTFLHFENYDGSQLFEILEKMAKDADYQLNQQAREKMVLELDEVAAHPPKDFANGRYVRLRLEKAMSRQAARLFGSDQITDEDLITLTASDFD